MLMCMMPMQEGRSKKDKFRVSEKLLKTSLFTLDFFFLPRAPQMSKHPHILHEDHTFEHLSPSKKLFFILFYYSLGVDEPGH